MRALGLVLALAVGAGREGRPCIEHRWLAAPDGVRLALYRYVPAVPSPLPAVLMLPDLGMTRRVLDTGADGPARDLWERGREVFILEPRGHGRSEAPTDWGLLDILQRDLPAAVAAIQAVHPGRVDAVGYGYAGALVLAAAAGELDGQVRRVWALATPAVASVPGPLAARVLREGGRLSSLGEADGAGGRFALLFLRHGLVPPGRARFLAEHGMADLSPRAARELLAWMEAGDLPLAPHDSLQARLARLDLPVLAMVGLADNWVHPEAATLLRELAPRAHVQVRLLSRTDLLDEDYAHLSLVQGAHARRDVDAPGARFLNAP